MLKKLAPIIFITFVNTIGFSLLIPVMPFVVEQYGAGALGYAILISSYSIFQFFGSPVLGSLSDIYGRKKVLLISHFGTLISWVIFASAYFVDPSRQFMGVSLSLFVIMFSRMLDGITGGNNSVANAYVSDVTTPTEKTKAFGLIGATFGIGFVFGPAIGAFTASTQYGYLGTVVISFFISLITLFTLAFFLKETVDTSNAKSVDVFASLRRSLNFVSKAKRYSSNKLVTTIFSIRFMFAFVFVAYTSIAALFFKESLNLNQQQIGFVFTFLGLFLIANQAFVVPRVTKMFGNYKPLLVGQIIMVLGFFFVLFISSVYIYLPIAYFLNFGMVSAMLILRTILANNTPKETQGEILGLEESIISFNSAFVPLISGVIFAAVQNYLFLLLSLLSLATVYLVTKLKGVYKV
jgi:DHA1 family tetracycline resistance protein-like MFS transporter